MGAARVPHHNVLLFILYSSSYVQKVAFTALLLLATEKTWPQKTVLHQASPTPKEKTACAIAWVEVTRQCVSTHQRSHQSRAQPSSTADGDTEARDTQRFARS